ncbi:hypothetical protein GCK72_012728 [Caenorhabditis remanei]|uniref:Serpentine receptor class gamma n=1 Tax=Caenorhabditis remanei TaxID=31234 RepID=A0A6A5GP11_CAERE|nr:hypothetical protein GCK72_012728 [Caenorhabditis remanei]KAF1756275.1 hypothetical protein GCK72_012728 [Caenorhabditis remanei]
MASSFLYIPIMLSIRKFSYLPSSQDNKPQKFILWQTVIILIFKFSFFPSVVHLSIIETPLWAIIFTLVCADIVLIPLIIQVSYLGCNKRNVNTLISSFTLIKFIRVLSDRKRQATVQPGVEFTFASSQAFI